MAGYSDTRQLIIDTLMGRPAGTEIQPEDHQAFALALNDYIRSVELVAGSGVPVDFAEPNTVPIQPDNGNAVYLSYVPRSTTKNFVNFINQSGNSISVTSSSGEVNLVTLLWNGSYWSSQTVAINVLSDDSNVNASNIGASDYILFSASSNYSIGDIVRYDGKLYKFTSAHAAGNWLGTDVELASINSILTSKLTELESQIGTQKGLSTDIDIDNLPNGIVSFTATSVPVGLPNIDYGAGATIITTKKSNENLLNYDRQVLITKQYICTRPYYNGWQEWEKSQVANIQLGLISSIDIDNLPNGTLSFTATSVPDGLPNIDYGAGALLVTMRNNSLKNLDRQFIITTKSISTRPYYNGWQEWETTDIDAGGKFLQKGLSSDIDVDNLANGIVSFTATTVPSGMPNIDYGAGATIITTRVDKNTLANFDRQVIFTPKVFATRSYYQGIWANWETYNYQDNIIHCGQGQKYTRLRDAVAAAIEVENTKVVIHPGTYNLAEEFAEEIANQNGTGIVLHNGVHLLFMSGSYVTCEIDVSNEWAYSNFEPFSAYKDFTLENAHIICRNTRYCVHDELNGASTYHHRYINCHMEYTNEHESANFTQCIGGGMGEHGYIEIIGGYYKSSSKYYQAHYNSTDDMQQPISFHNGISDTCDGKIVIKDVYLADKGYFRFGMYGGSTKKTPIYISGCRMYKAPFLMNEQWNDSQIQNMEVIAWNNEIVE